jgi:hypothetical protein
MIRRACLLGGILAWFLLGSNGAHLLLVEHSRCAEHGEMVHHGAAHHHGASGDLEPGSAAFHGTPDDQPEDGHEHCALSAEHRPALIAISDSRWSAQVREARVECALVAALVATDSARFRIAPKNSPPA